MSRLTERFHEDGLCYGKVDCEDNCTYCNRFLKVLNKLCDYEDAEEQCIKETTYGFKELLHKWKTFTDDVQELLEYRRLEEQGLLIKLPCEIGEIVYSLEGDKIKRYAVTHYEINEDGTWCEDGWNTIGLFGKSVFATKEAAEKKLESMKGE